MADDIEAHVATEASEVPKEPESSKSDLVVPDAPSQPHDPQGHGKSDAPTPAARGKRAIDDGNAEEDEDEDKDYEPEQNLPPRKKARTGRAPVNVVEQGNIKSDSKDNDDGEGDSVRSSPVDETGPRSSFSVASKDFDRAGWSASNKDAYSDLITQARISREAKDKPSQQAAPSTAAVGLHTSSAKAAASVPAGLRTTFGATPFKGFEMHNTPTNDERNQLVATVRDHGALNVARIIKRDLEWTVSPLQVEFLVGNTWVEIWEATVDKWCEAFLADNEENIAVRGLATSLLKNAFFRRLDECKKLPQTFFDISIDLLKHPGNSRLRKFSSNSKRNEAKHEAKLARKKARKEAKVAARQASTQAAKAQAKAKAASEAKDADEAKSPSGSFTPINPQERSTDDRTAGSAPSVHEEISGGPEESGIVDTENVQDTDEMEDGEINSANASGADMELDEDDAPTADADGLDRNTGKDGEALSQAELDQRRHYFPGIPDDAVFCLTCGHIGHRTEKCPELICKFCQGPHFKYECLMRQRCGKCKQLGHTKASCSEKLAVAPGEAAVECAICEGHDHTEIDCIELYQIYKPQLDKVKKVQHIPAFCYVCGIEGHFGGDCSMADYNIPPTKVWTMATASLYIDPSSENIALSLQKPLPPPADDAAPKIPGRSIKRQTHEVYVEDDDDGDGDLLGPRNSKGGKKGFFESNKFSKAKPKTAPKINISSNVTFGSNQGPANSNSNQPHLGHWTQLPLPKRQKGPAQTLPKSKRPTNDALPGTKPFRGKPNKQQQQPSSNSNRGGGGGARGRGGGGGGGGRGGGGFSALNTNDRGGRRSRRRGGGGGGQT